MSYLKPLSDPAHFMTSYPLAVPLTWTRTYTDTVSAITLKNLSVNSCVSVMADLVFVHNSDSVSQFLYFFDRFALSEICNKQMKCTNNVYYTIGVTIPGKFLITALVRFTATPVHSEQLNMWRAYAAHTNNYSVT